MAVILKTSCTGRTTVIRFPRTRAVAVADHPRSIYSLHDPEVYSRDVKNLFPEYIDARNSRNRVYADDR
jgi:hypothetical protein